MRAWLLHILAAVSGRKAWAQTGAAGGVPSVFVKVVKIASGEMVVVV